MSRGALLRIVLLAAVLGAAVLGWWLLEGQLDPAAVEAAFGKLGWLGPLMFVAAFALATVLFLPGSIFSSQGSRPPCPIDWQ